MRYSINDVVVLREDYASNSISKRDKMFAGKKCVITAQLHHSENEDEDVFEVRLYDKPEEWDSCSAGWIEGRTMTGVDLHGKITDEYGRDINPDKFYDEFIKWVEDNHYQFGGTIGAYETVTRVDKNKVGRRYYND